MQNGGVARVGVAFAGVARTNDDPDWMYRLPDGHVCPVVARNKTLNPDDCYDDAWRQSQAKTKKIMAHLAKIDSASGRACVARLAPIAELLAKPTFDPQGAACLGNVATVTDMISTSTIVPLTSDGRDKWICIPLGCDVEFV